MLANVFNPSSVPLFTVKLGLVSTRSALACVDGGREAAVHTKDALVDDSCQRQVVKHFSAVAPYIGRAAID